MQTVGILLLSIAVWLIYCGVSSIPPWDTALAIIKNPDKASEIIADARKAAAEKNKAASLWATASGSNLFDAAATTVLGGSVNPFAAFPISDDFGARGGEHKGIDYIMPVGTPLPAAASGVVHFTANNGTAGNQAAITTKDGYKIIYMHLTKMNTNLEGKSVTWGQIIGYSGGAKGAEGAGNSTGPHLHFQVNSPQGNPINPRDYFNGAGKNNNNLTGSKVSPNSPFSNGYVGPG